MKTKRNSNKRQGSKSSANKKGQAAMEFLMSYGWAILVVIAAIAALAYFGVLAPSEYVPDKCILPSGLVCLDSVASPTGFSVVVKNGVEFDIIGMTVSVNGSGCNANATGPSNLDKGDQGIYNISCGVGSGQYSGALHIVYTNSETLLVHQTVGELVKNIS